jgi:TetR/AcrR family acrAB operon transcriptional repressor
MISRCEYVDEFASVQEGIGRPALTFLEKIERVYQNAANKNMLRQGLDPQAMARDTCAFTSGLLHLLLSCQKGDIAFARQVPQMIVSHMALRRCNAA